MATESREVSDFDQVEVCCGMQLVLTQGDQDQLMLEAEDNILPEIETIVRGDRLSVRFRRKLGWLNLRVNQPVIVRLQMANIHGVDISGGGWLDTDGIETDRITLEFNGGSRATIGTLQADSSSLSASGGGQIQIERIMVDTLALDVSGGGRVTIQEGAATALQANISGGSHYLADGVESENAMLKVGGGGEAEVWVTEALRVQASGGSHVAYRGNPSIDQELSGGSDLRSLSQ